MNKLLGKGGGGGGGRGRGSTLSPTPAIVAETMYYLIDSNGTEHNEEMTRKTITSFFNFVSCRSGLWFPKCLKFI